MTLNHWGSFGAYGINCSFETEGKEVYLFKGNKYVRIDYDSKQPIRKIKRGFPVLKGTIFEDGIDGCFTSHKENQVYLFKGENYVLMNFSPGTKDHTLVDVVKPIVDGWSSLRGILPLDNKGLIEFGYEDEFPFLH
ncbi:hypothetical protein PHAVU_007G252000 [Phaseolus vulgaris]|uniref:Uncharacterized protein n=1 Tax=Phaseolus vulgaris TaxID=3885 RepID=V7BKL6_PHAVU|nr:hypothetical protein PHAVU_007G252000g [Phaseolus vulgaris]ESW17590.1 hypothetical protein PHAVU_007G252000g [Phaseolus vulgaris]